MTETRLFNSYYTNNHKSLKSLLTLETFLSINLMNMAHKDFLIDLCRYYDGSADNENTGDNGMFFDIEKMWVRLTADKNDKVLPSMLEDYLSVGLREFELNDDTPTTLKALLFNAFAKRFSGSATQAATEFKKFYLERYTQQQ